MKTETKTVLQQIIGSTLVLDLKDLRTVMHERKEKNVKRSDLDAFQEANRIENRYNR